MTGIVYKSTGSWYTIKTENGAFLECRIKGKFRMKGIKSTNPIAVGDVVDYDIENTTDETTGVITNIHERKNYIVRKSVNLSHQMHIIASNIDVVFLLVTINNPPTTTSFIDRFLVTAEAYGIEAVIVFNKIDTFDDPTLDEQLYLQHVYSSIGYKCLRVSAKDGKGIDELKALMKDKVSMFSGHSGVGKSTLVNTLEPSGIRGFGIVDMEKQEIGDYFPEFFAIKDQCKFNNCLHKDEPHCAVKNALEKDEITWSRYKSYTQILEGDEEQYRADIYDAERRASDETRK
jgi:ribosome biogenesis GTPase / thiamine phosphate phosphatase